jgi:hypothetical protein
VLIEIGTNRTGVSVSFNPGETVYYTGDSEAGIYFDTESETTKDKTISKTVFSYSATNKVVYSLGNFFPNTSGLSLGDSNHQWDNIATQSSTRTGSDERLKNTIEPLPQNYETFFGTLKPISYILNNGQSGRKHLGFIA